MNPAFTTDLLTLPAAARQLGVSAPTLAKHASSVGLQIIQLGRRRMLLASEFRDYRASLHGRRQMTDIEG
jgi:hypothetical protein